MTTGTFAVLLETRHAPAEISSVLADGLAVPLESVGEQSVLEASRAEWTPIVFELTELEPGGFAQELSVSGAPGLRSNLDLARLLAPRLNERVLGSPMKSDGSVSKNPYAWILVTPDGRAQLTISDPMKEPAIVVGNRREPWPPAPPASGEESS